MGILLGVSLLIFGLLHRAMPRSYARILDEQVFENAVELARELEVTPRDEWDHLLVLFSVENQANVVFYELGDEDEAARDDADGVGIFISEITATVVDGDVVIMDSEGMVISSEGNTVLFDLFGTQNSVHTSLMFSFYFEYEQAEYVMVVESQNFVRAASQMEMIFLQLAPYIFLIILGVSLVTSFFYTRILARPVVDIARQSMKLVDLDGSWEWESNRRDEIGMLGGYLKMMYDQLMATLDELRYANGKLQDEIERERELERRRRDFFTAISHELKTPVTILKGELEGMILNVGKFKDRDKYLQEAYATSESIEKLVREIMMLAKLDTINLKLENVDFGDMVADVLAIYEPMVEEKQLEVKRMGVPSFEVRADATQLQTVLSNIISNAIKHTPAGSCIWVNLEKESDTAVLKVENEGVYLEEMEIDKLWEPFYRPDKSRNRDTGGSGLGLYIVKSILDLHGFECGLHNTSRGVLFVVRVPFDAG